jgi:hypothetical protein
MTIAIQLKTGGVAEVLVMLDPATVGDSTATEATAHKVTKHFTSSELAHDKQFLRAFAPNTPKTDLGITPIAARSTKAFRVYPHLGIVYGTVDRAGLSRLRLPHGPEALARLGG